MQILPVTLATPHDPQKIGPNSNCCCNLRGWGEMVVAMWGGEDLKLRHKKEKK